MQIVSALVIGSTLLILLYLHHLKEKIMGELDTLETEVSETRTVMDSAIVLLQGLKAKLDAAGTDPVKLKALSDSLDTGTNALAAAVVANTPADPIP